jgi:dihydroorotate dehydrogenase
MSTLFRRITSRLPLPTRSTIFVVGAGSFLLGWEYTTHTPSTKFRSTLLYHHVADQIITPSLRQWFDPETAHRLAIYFAQHGWAPIHHSSAIEQRCHMETKLEFDTTSTKKNNGVQVRPLRVPHVIGLAAGFDKDAVIIQPMLLLGFAFTEVGTVTLQPQAGNPAPRMFRLPSDYAIINRYGFNSSGASVIEENLSQYRIAQKEKHPVESDENFFVRASRWLFPPITPVGAVGVNLGINSTSVEESDVVTDYTTLIKKLGPYADYLVINVSSPNTPGLRDWQTNEGGLHALLTACLTARNALSEDSSSDDVPPLFVKLAPDLTTEELNQIAKICEDVGIDGFVVANTTNQRPADLIHHHLATLETGGLSGKPVRDLATSMIRTLYAATDGRIPIIGVGGITSGHDAYEKLRAGASLVQVYSHLVYAGPGFVSRLRQELAQLLVLHGHRNVADVVGLDHEEITWQKRHELLALRDKTEKQLYEDATTDDSNDETSVTSVQP